MGLGLKNHVITSYSIHYTKLYEIGRTGAFLDELKQQPFQNVAIVAHGGIVRALDCLINGTDPIDAFKSNVDYGQLIDFNL